jgi:hypothetical protein
MSYRAFRFDFDEWMNLAKSDPEAFDARRKQVIDDLIEHAPEHIRQRLKSFQWRIDMERARCENPLQACIKLSNMMWELVYGDRGFLWSLQQFADPKALPANSAAASASAQILPLRPPGPKPE